MSSVDSDATGPQPDPHRGRPPEPGPSLSTRDAVAAIVQGELEGTNGRRDMLLTDYLLVAVSSGWDADGEDVTQVVMVPGGATYRMLGLVQEARVRLEGDLLDFFRGDRQ